MKLMQTDGLRMKSVAVLLGGTALAAITSIPANALTASGDVITNTASVTYNIGGQPQTPPPDAEVSFTVDRIIDVTVDYVTGPTSVSPNTSYTYEFTVTNDGNATQDYGLDTLSPFGTTADADGTLEAGEYQIWIDDGDGIRNAGDTLYTGDPNQLSLVAGDSATVFIDVWTDFDLATDDSVELLATTYETDGVTLPTATAAGDFTIDGAPDTVFLDTSGTWTGTPADVDADARHSDQSGNTTVAAASLSVTKSVDVMAIPSIGGTAVSAADCLADDVAIAQTDAAYLPGTCLRYTITVTNSGNAAADVVAIYDNLAPLPVTFVGFPTGYNADFGGAAPDVAAAFAADAVTATEGLLAAGATATLTFHVLVN